MLDCAEHVLKEEGGSHIPVLMHSLAFGTLRPYTSEQSEEAITKGQMEVTLDVMAHSLMYWV
jgi:enoyl-[acyl-carrier protein] reductase III